MLVRTKGILAASAAAGVVVAALVIHVLLAQPAIDPALRCRLGTYALNDGRFLAINGFDGTPQDLRYTLSSGEYGHLLPGNAAGAYTLSAPPAPPQGAEPAYGSVSFTDCATGKVTFRETGRPVVTGAYVPWKVIDTFFDSAGTRLHGKLVLPVDGKAKAIVVWVTGSDDDPETDDAYWQYVLPLHGIGVFVYDKRGTGQSQGSLSADFYVRAADTAAAVQDVRTLEPAVTRIGVFGGSQGGWVVPLTATKTDVAFVIVGYGLAEGVTAQDSEEVEEEVRAAGYGDVDMKKVREITEATTRIVASGWHDGWPEFVALKEKYAGEPWIKAIDAENGYTGLLLRTSYPTPIVRLMGPLLDKHVSFGYDPRPVIATIAPPQLWLLGGLDHTTPNAKTIGILKTIQSQKRALDIVVYKDADHGLAETFTFGGITRHRYPGDLTDVVARWILSGKLPDPSDKLNVWPNRRSAATP
jgi:pimeloyl-ACP methyl ester carboxylesterase